MTKVKKNFLATLLAIVALLICGIILCGCDESNGEPETPETEVEYSISFPSQVLVLNEQGGAVSATDTLHYGDVIVISYTESSGCNCELFTVNGTSIQNGTVYTVVGNTVINYSETEYYSLQLKDAGAYVDSYFIDSDGMNYANTPDFLSFDDNTLTFGSYIYSNYYIFEDVAFTRNGNTLSANLTIGENEYSVSAIMYSDYLISVDWIDSHTYYFEFEKNVDFDGSYLVRSVTTYNGTTTTPEGGIYSYFIEYKDGVVKYYSKSSTQESTDSNYYISLANLAAAYFDLSEETHEYALYGNVLLEFDEDGNPVMGSVITINNSFFIVTTLFNTSNTDCVSILWQTDYQIVTDQTGE